MTIEQVGHYQYPGQERYELWYKCPKRSCTVYIEFLDGWDDEREVRKALNAAIEKDTCAISVTREHTDSTNGVDPQPVTQLKFSVCEFKPYRPHFNSDFCAVDHDELIDLEQLKYNVTLVSFQGDKFVYKFMTQKGYQNTFETEAINYKKLILVGAAGVPVLRAVVRKAGLIQGLLVSYIEGSDLRSAVQNGDIQDELLLNITYRIIKLAADLERIQFYHEDLKCSNIVRRDADGELYFIDFGGGFTEGMYREERLNHIWFKGLDASDALFMLGRTIWELWVAESPSSGADGAPLDRVRNEAARNIIRDCEEGNMESIVHLSKKFVMVDDVWYFYDDCIDLMGRSYNG